VFCSLCIKDGCVMQHALSIPGARRTTNRWTNSGNGKPDPAAIHDMARTIGETSPGVAFNYVELTIPPGGCSWAF
jgi:hypothetical protein